MQREPQIQQLENTHSFINVIYKIDKIYKNGENFKNVKHLISPMFFTTKEKKKKNKYHKKTKTNTGKIKNPILNN